VFANRTTRVLGGVTANFYRLCLSTTLLAIWAHAFGKGLGGGAFGFFFLSGCIGFGFGDLALYQALPRLGPRLTILMVHCLAAPFATLVEWLWMGTTLSPAQLVSALVILAGVALALAPGEHLHIPRNLLIGGIVLGLIAAIGQGGGAVVSRKAYAFVRAGGQNIDGLTAAYQRILGGLVFALPPSLWIIWKKRQNKGAAENAAEFPKAKFKSVPIWLWVVVNSLAGPTVGVGCYQWALGAAPSGVVLAIVATTPLAVIPFAHLMDGERPGPRSLAGGVIAVAGAISLALAR
jgi:drug/metabolite transporter (DMT)-like permease